jgi:hypothetical protein
VDHLFRGSPFSWVLNTRFGNLLPDWRMRAPWDTHPSVSPSWRQAPRRPRSDHSVKAQTQRDAQGRPGRPEQNPVRRVRRRAPSYHPRRAEEPRVDSAAPPAAPGRPPCRGARGPRREPGEAPREPRRVFLETEAPSGRARSRWGTARE